MKYIQGQQERFPTPNPRMKYMKAAPRFPIDYLMVISWPDDVIDQLGHEPHSGYVERYWLGVLGPTAT
jgi:hypothetical protein